MVSTNLYSEHYLFHLLNDLLYHTGIRAIYLRFIKSQTKTTIMKQIATRLNLLFAILLFTAYVSNAQNTNNQQKKANESKMKTFVIEREIPNAGKLTAEELKGISQKSCSVLRDLGPQIQWIHSYVTGNKIYCIYKAENIELIREHAKKGGFPANSISEVSSVISPATAE